MTLCSGLYKDRNVAQGSKWSTEFPGLEWTEIDLRRAGQPYVLR
jgi:hypothetical protein